MKAVARQIDDKPRATVRVDDSEMCIANLSMPVCPDLYCPGVDPAALPSTGDGSPGPEEPSPKRRKTHWATLSDLVSSGWLKAGDVIVIKARARRGSHRAFLLTDGKLIDTTGKILPSLNAVCREWYGRGDDGWLVLMRDGGQQLAWYRDRLEQGQSPPSV